MFFTKKHFELLAVQIRLIEDSNARFRAYHAVVVVAIEVNPSFDIVKFVKACGVSF
jgi:hypothetical protein